MTDDDIIFGVVVLAALAYVGYKTGFLNGANQPINSFGCSR